MNEITTEELHEVLHYDPLTGIFAWKVAGGNGVKKGSEAGSLTPRGYIAIKIKGKSYRAHRLAWLYVHGYFPEHGLDHRNRIRSDNWILNLREASQTCNMRNRKILKNNKSGVTGVSFQKQANKFHASIQANSKKIHLGYFTTLVSAAQARWDAEVKYDFPTCNTTSSAYLYLQKNKQKRR